MQRPIDHEILDRLPSWASTLLRLLEPAEKEASHVRERFDDKVTVETLDEKSK